MLTLTPKQASGSLRSWRARAEQIPARRAGALPLAPAIAFGTGRPLHSSDRLSADALPSTVESDPPIEILKEVNERVTVTQGELAIKLLD